MSAPATTPVATPAAKPAQPATQQGTPIFSTLAGGVGSLLGGTSTLLMAVLGLLPTIIFSWGAAKLNWSVNQSWFWATIAFLFSGIYYPYYAFFVLPAPTSTLLGAARRAARR